ncbi:hypothetical protein ACFE04_001720 [Oxalis oulophora]
MDSETFSPSSDLVKCCNCACCTCSSSTSLTAVTSPRGAWLRSVKRKHDEFERGNAFIVPGLDFNFNPRVQVENECAALREMVATQQQTVQDLYEELEEERNAASTAANEAMSMILRLQREKAEIQMEARQFKRFSEEKMIHDQQELQVLEDLLYKREQSIQSLTCEVQAYKHRMMSFGLSEAEADGDREGISRNPSMLSNFEGEFDFPPYGYPPLKCNLNENPGPLEDDEEIADVEKYAFGETPRDRLKNLEDRINLMERSPTCSSHVDSEFNRSRSVLEKVIVGYSPRKSRHSRKFSTDSSNSLIGTDREARPDLESPRFGSSFRKNETFSRNEDSSSFRKKGNNLSEFGDNVSDRVYSLDSLQNPKPANGVFEDFNSSPRENQPDMSDPYIKKLNMRVQALEADRASMSQAIISMSSDKAHMMILKELAQQLKGARKMSERQVPADGKSSFTTVLKWIVSFVNWRKKARRNNEQPRFANDSRQKPSHKAIQMFVEYTIVTLSRKHLCPYGSLCSQV